MLRFKWETPISDRTIEKIPDEWERKNLGHVAELRREHFLPKDEDARLYVGLEHIEEGTLTLKGLGKSKDVVSSKSVFKKGDILFGKLRPYFRKVILAPFDGVCSTDILVIKPKTKMCNKYLFYLLASKQIIDSVSTASEGTKMPRTSWGFLESIEVNVPPYEEQKRIGEVLSWFNELVENKKSQNDILEKSAMALFKSWFIDFEPFKNSKFVGSEFGEIPREFEVKPLREAATLFKGVSYNSSDINLDNQGNLFITLNNFLREGGFKTEYDYYIGPKAKEDHKVKERDLIIALTDMTPLAKVVGSPAVVSLPHGHDFAIISLDCAKLQPHKEYLRYYLYLYLKHTQEDNSTFANGVNVLHLNTELFMRNKLILMPPESVLEKFHFSVEPLFQKIILNQKQILVLRKILDSLIPLLVFGKLRVEEI